MASEWRELPIGELAEIFDGPHATPPKTSYGPVFLGISNLARGRLDLANTEHLSEEDYTRWTRRIEPQTGDVVFSYETRLGEAASIPTGLRCCLGRRMGLLRARADKVDKRFLLYAYLGPQFQETLRSRTIHGSTVDRIPLIEMSDFPMEVPNSIDEQRAIARILGTLDDKIELNRRMNETLEAMARALFTSWFVDFDPVRAKAEGRDPGLPKPLADLFPTSFEDSELGEIPKGWGIGRLEDIASVTMGLSPEGESYNADGVGIALINGPVEFGDHFPVKTKWTTSPTRLAQAGDLILCVRGSTTGRRVVADGSYCLGRGVCAIRAKNHQRTFVYQTVNIGLDRLLSNTTGSVFPNLSAPDIKGFPILIPPQRVVDTFGRSTEPLTERAEANVGESRTLAALRDALLPKLISGELRVSDAGRFIRGAYS
jgi:type I restriction enzyme S subunit